MLCITIYNVAVTVAYQVILMEPNFNYYPRRYFIVEEVKVQNIPKMDELKVELG